MWEGGGLSSLGGLIYHPIPVDKEGKLPISLISKAIRPEDVHASRTGAIVIENTQNEAGGVPLPKSYIDEVAALSPLPLHIDGARIFNAAVALGDPVANLTSAANSVSFCLSKGLCAPIGSVLVGSSDFIYEARRLRKTLGGGMRQVGVIAAAGIVALDEMTERLEEDHQNAATLASYLRLAPGISDVICHTNLIYFRLEQHARISPSDFVDELKAERIIVSHDGDGHFRFVTHYYVTEEDVDRVIRVLTRLLKGDF